MCCKVFLFFTTDRMNATRNYIFTNKYFPTATKTDLKLYERDLNTWFNEFNTWFNPDQYFSNVKLVNFDIIYKDIRKSQLQKPFEEYQTIHKNDFKGYNQKLKDEMLTVAYRSERKDVFLRKI